MSLRAGQKLAHYEIVEPLGKGGMGEVFRARDTRLGRDVAIKILPEAFANDQERLARFEREAKLLASLNHPNIASIFGFEGTAIVLELVDGPTLAERIEQGPIPVDEAIATARQIVEALAAGHEAGVVHRDLKPANIKVKEDGTVKVLDYGLAKALEGETTSAGDAELSQSPTLTRQNTRVGVILGTAAYMSPEQAKGKRVDARADIWAFGAVVYEMLTGERAFAGENVSDTLAAVLRAEPDLDALPKATPRSLRRVVELCLTKDVKARFHAMGDVRLALAGAFDFDGEPAVVVRRPSSAIALALLLSAATGVAVWLLTRSPDRPRAVVRSSIVLPRGQSLSGLGFGRTIALSADGTQLAYLANNRINIRAMDRNEPSVIEGTEGAERPFLSPDGEWLGFYSGGQLEKISTRGGAPVALCDATNPYGVRWDVDDTIVFGQRGVGVVRVSAAGGAREVLVALSETNEMAHGPQVLPGGDWVLFTLGEGPNTWDRAQIVAQSIDGGERRVLIERGRDARYLATGHLVYVRDGTLLAVPFDVGELRVTGGPVPVADGVEVARRTGAGDFDVSASGTVVYRPLGYLKNTLAWVDREGREEAISAEPRGYVYPSISPDGRRIALDVRAPESDVWIWDFDRETLMQLTFNPGQDALPVWMPNGTGVLFGSDRDGIVNIYRKAADGSGPVERLSESERAHMPQAITPDGERVVYSELEAGTNERGRFDLGLGVLTLVDGAMDSLAPLVTTGLANADISPDGKWLAYESTASGQAEIYVRPFPNVEDGQWPISTGGGTRPRWAPGGGELFYMAPGARLMAVAVETDPSFAAGNAKFLFDGYYAAMSGRTYDVSPDGKRFLMIKPGADAAGLVVVANLFDQFRDSAAADDR